ncbi:MAG: class IV adenylate cyclase [Terriglobia bacterium]
MKLLNFEFKARLDSEPRVREALKKLNAHFVGTDHQIDTYFRVPCGRLKVREGRLENALIFYLRSTARRARRSAVEMMLLPRRNPLRAILGRALGTLAVVDKRREIYFVKNVKIHLDRIRQLGKFLEVEAISRAGDVKKIRSQARQFQELFGITAKDIIAESYSDLILAKSAGTGKKGCS